MYKKERKKKKMYQKVNHLDNFKANYHIMDTDKNYDPDKIIF